MLAFDSGALMPDFAFRVLEAATFDRQLREFALHLT